MSFGSMEKWMIPEEQALPILKHAYDKGIVAWDTVSNLHVPKHLTIAQIPNRNVLL